MQLEGHDLTKRNMEYCVLPRSGKDIVIKCQAVLDYDEFEKLCPVPSPPTVMKKGGVKEPDVDDPGYSAQVKQRAENKIYYIILKSLEATEGLKWDSVKNDDPKTWKNYRKELKEANFTDAEINRIELAVFTANSLNEAAIEKARENFLNGLGDQNV